MQPYAIVAAFVGRLASSPLRSGTGGPLGLLLLWGLAVAACEQDPPQPVARNAEPAPRRQRVCRDEQEDPGLGLPLRVASSCLDVRVDVRRYGPGLPLGLDWGCSDLFASECENYKLHGLRSVKTFRYASETGSLEVSGIVSEFTRSRGAFGLYSERARSSEQREEKREGGGSARMSRTGRFASVWAGRRVLELAALDPQQGGSELGPEAARDWARLTKELLAQFGREEPLLYELILLEGEDELASRVVFFEDELLQIRGSGSGALAEYGEAGDAYRQIVSVRRDDASAKDFLNQLGRELSGHPMKNKSVVRARRRREGFAPETWYFARSGRVVVGVGPGEESAGAVSSEDEWQRRALAKLAALSSRASRNAPPEFQ